MAVANERGISEHKNEVLSRLYLQKSIGWDYEKEHRLVLAKSDFDKVKSEFCIPEGDYIRFSKIKIERVILGINTSYENYKMLSQVIDDFTPKNNRPIISKVYQNEDDYDISLMPSAEFYDADIPF